MELAEWDDAIEAIIQATNPNLGTWSGELNLTFESDGEPSVRHVLVDNVAVELGPDGILSLFVLMTRPSSNGTYRAFGVSGEKAVPLTVKSLEAGNSLKRP